jgi:hypothetical protein
MTRYGSGGKVRAFLSHSSKDKIFVRQIANILGPLQIELDERTFEYAFNVGAIRDALTRSDLFVYFLSTNSITSNFVKEEHRAALEARGAGTLKRVLIFAIDGTSYTALPAWMQEINVVQRVGSAKTCARQIQATLLELAADEDPGLGLYLGRDADEAELRRALAVPPAKTPVFLHAVGHYGIGRRSFLRNSLQKLFPRLYITHVEVALAQYEGVEELYRHLYGLHRVSALEETLSAFSAFSEMSPAEQIQNIADIIKEMAALGEYVIIVDEGGVYSDDGNYQKFLADLLVNLTNEGRPLLMFIQTRMMPFSVRANYPRAFHQYLKPLSNEIVGELMSLSLKELGVDFTEKQISDVLEHLDGHPYNIRFAVQFVINFGIESLIQDPSDLIDWKNRRAVDFLKRIEFDELESELMAVLSEYQYISSTTLVEVLKANPTDLARTIRRMQEFCCVERRESYFYIAAPIRDGVRRDNRFERGDAWKQNIGQVICNLISDYTNEDRVPVSIVETATLAAARSKTPPAFLSNLILPSHLLKLARETYDAGKRSLCIDLCARVFDMRNRLPTDAHIEVLRLWGLSAVRTGNLELFKEILSKIEMYQTPIARRTALFLEGFYFRLKGDLDAAEDKFVAAWSMAKSNQSLNRELASLYCKQRRCANAEAHARAAYEIAPTNPYIIDIFAETLLGKQSVGLKVSADEIKEVLDQLKIYGDAPGSSFFLVRDAQQRFKRGDKVGAMVAITKAISRTPSLLPAYFIRAEFFLATVDPDGADRDLHEIGRLLSDAGGFSDGDEARAQELEVRIMIERHQFKAAKDKIITAAFLPRVVEKRLLDELARAISYEPDRADAVLREWAKGHSFGPSMGRVVPRRRRIKHS